MMLMVYMFSYVCFGTFLARKEQNLLAGPGLTSRLISCSSIVTLSMVFLKSRNRQRVCRALLICINSLRIGSDQPSLFTCGLNTSD